MCDGRDNLDATNVFFFNNSDKEVEGKKEREIT